MLSIIVPCYNEEKNIPLIVNKFTDILNENKNVEVILVNNGSTDNSIKEFNLVLDEVNKNEKSVLFGKNLKIVTVEKNIGYGFGILTGLNNAGGDILAWTHADLQTDPADVIVAYNKFLEVNNEFLLVKGKRKIRRFAEAFFTFGMQVISSLLLRTWLSDINAQPKLFSRKFYYSIKAKAPFDFSLDLYFLYMAKKIGTVQTIPVYFNKRMFGEAKGGGSLKTRIKLIKRTFAYIIKFEK